jgi:mRNA-degrading endonuclease RelE of RelBE toxin-antitoxin system
MDKMIWTVTLSPKVHKSLKNLPQPIRERLAVLVQDITYRGPVRGEWLNYSKLEKDIHHCHLKKGKPTYIAVWKVENKRIRLIEVIYAGTHEKAPY